ncbi:hypothetical protein MINTM002_29220 [Mycobacterium intracellulare]|nr:hypothetical protein MINTM002_29220 [Mycobacterium intracellulare]
MSDGVNPPPPERTWAQMPASAANHNRPSRATCSSSSADGAQVQLACRRGPSAESTVAALSSRVCINGMAVDAAARVTDQPSGTGRHMSAVSSPEPPWRPR